jgi:hypothetical protein
MQRLEKLHKQYGGAGESVDAIESADDAQVKKLVEDANALKLERSLLSTECLTKFGHIPSHLAFGAGTSVGDASTPHTQTALNYARIINS